MVYTNSTRPDMGPLWGGYSGLENGVPELRNCNAAERRSRGAYSNHQPHPIRTTREGKFAMGRHRLLYWPVVSIKQNSFSFYVTVRGVRTEKARQNKRAWPRAPGTRNRPRSIPGLRGSGCGSDVRYRYEMQGPRLITRILATLIRLPQVGISFLSESN